MLGREGGEDAARELLRVPRITHRLAIASWESLISTLLNDLSAPSDYDALADVSQLSALCDRLLSGEIAVPPGGPGWDKRDRQLRAMVDAMTARLVESRHADTKGYHATPGPGYYKRYMTLSGRKNWCVEFNLDPFPQGAPPLPLVNQQLIPDR